MASHPQHAQYEIPEKQYNSARTLVAPQPRPPHAQPMMIYPGDRADTRYESAAGIRPPQYESPQNQYNSTPRLIHSQTQQVQQVFADPHGHQKTTYETGNAMRQSQLVLPPPHLQQDQFIEIQDTKFSEEWGALRQKIIDKAPMDYFLAIARSLDLYAGNVDIKDKVEWASDRYSGSILHVAGSPTIAHLEIAGCVTSYKAFLTALGNYDKKRPIDSAKRIMNLGHGKGKRADWADAFLGAYHGVETLLQLKSKDRVLHNIFEQVEGEKLLRFSQPLWVKGSDPSIGTIPVASLNIGNSDTLREFEAQSHIRQLRDFPVYRPNGSRMELHQIAVDLPGSWVIVSARLHYYEIFSEGETKCSPTLEIMEVKVIHEAEPLHAPIINPNMSAYDLKLAEVRKTALPTTQGLMQTPSPSTRGLPASTSRPAAVVPAPKFQPPHTVARPLYNPVNTNFNEGAKQSNEAWAVSLLTPQPHLTRMEEHRLLVHAMDTNANKGLAQLESQHKALPSVTQIDEVEGNQAWQREQNFFREKEPETHHSQHSDEAQANIMLSQPTFMGGIGETSLDTFPPQAMQSAPEFNSVDISAPEGDTLVDASNALYRKEHNHPNMTAGQNSEAYPAPTLNSTSDEPPDSGQYQSYLDWFQGVYGPNTASMFHRSSEAIAPPSTQGSESTAWTTNAEPLFLNSISSGSSSTSVAPELLDHKGVLEARGEPTPDGVLEASRFGEKRKAVLQDAEENFAFKRSRMVQGELNGFELTGDLL
ncbi:hypothetical protein R3P38DRAFT_2764878 [Favolaschia claudopus]|uniref:Uncharacterized protein n=1 Tax=Favolaschia claudopus TaxID=2862362 RepID=A0AAW0DFU7_9AGAR